ncbi:EAL domain-containing protein [Blastochloris viridis]|uniref:cyclic-guanylate-specific phosphodiesterase n=1 Tax=Blastochloris viridis TaxID=1079 RepID=A0A0S4Q236_BLAVI|nr:EAL domain-containing protein [Blastochloris viridis]CUU41533.1 putative membrane protein YjcC [Blastochloris viridis]
MLFAALCCAGLIAFGIEAGTDVILRERGAAQAALQAKDILVRAEARLHRSAAALADLVAGGVKTCRQGDIEAMRRAVYATTPLKEVALVDAQGAVLCSHHGFGSDHRGMTAEQAIAGTSLTMSMVRFGDGQEPALRLRVAVGQHYLTVLVPAEVFETDDVAAPAQGLGIRLMLAGVPTVLRPLGEPVDSDDVQVATGSGQFPVSVEIVRTIEGLRANAAGPILYSRAGGLFISTLIFALALSTTRRRQDPVDDLRAAIDAGEMVPYYQPVMDISSGRLIGCEVLVRWRRPDGEVVPPSSFIPLAETSGLIFELTNRLMRTARDEVAAVYATRPSLKLGFNAHADHFLNDRIVADVEQVFGGSPIRLSQIMLEVTERAPLADLNEARRTIAALQALGVKVAIDDVGTGHGGLNYLLKLGVDTIKIDKMFIDAIGTERYSNAIIETLVELSRTMKIDVIAEGVETFDQVEYLRSHGVHMAQGHVFAPALPGGAFLDLCEAMCRDAAVPVATHGHSREPMPRYISARNRQFS